MCLSWTTFVLMAQTGELYNILSISKDCKTFMPNADFLWCDISHLVNGILYETGHGWSLSQFFQCLKIFSYQLSETYLLLK